LLASCTRLSEGKLDEVALYPGALTPGEIASHSKASAIGAR